MNRSCASFLAVLLSLCLSLVSCSGYRQAAQEPVAGTHKLGKKQMHRLVGFACKQLNAPYKWGGNTPKGFDCSGFTTYCFGHFGVRLPRTAADQSQGGKRIRSKKAKEGDLIFFKGPDRKEKKTGHVGIVVSGKRKNIRFIHAAGKGVMISSLGEEYFSQRYITIRRVRG